MIKMRGVTAPRFIDPNRDCFLYLTIKDVCTRGGIERRRVAATSTWESRTPTSLIDEAKTSPIGSSVEGVRVSSESFREPQRVVPLFDLKGLAFDRSRGGPARSEVLFCATAKRFHRSSRLASEP